MGSLGQLVVCIATILSAAGGALAWASQGRPRVFHAGRKMLHGASLAALVSLVILTFLLVTHDYRFSYIRDYADRTMSLAYLIMAVWGGQEGSLLLWAVLQTWFTSAVAATYGRNRDNLIPVVLGFLACIQVFFFCLVLFHSNPFETLGTVAFKGVGLNPLLRNPYMAVHPPTLFLGFVGFSVPQAFIFAALLSRTPSDEWLKHLRPWILVAWVFLSVGNILGMVWAYQELGWGGYWGWDPVENASFIPWLTGTALLHSVLLRSRKRAFQLWILVLGTITFLLVVFGTFLTRSGVIASVHAFAGATTGPFFLGLMACVGVSFLVLFIWRYRDFAKESPNWTVLSPEGMFTINNVVLILAAAFVWFATMAPLFTELFYGEKVAVTPEFFNKWMVPIGLFMLGVLLVCVVVGWRSLELGQFARRGFLPLVGFLLTGTLMALLVGIDTEQPGIGPYMPVLAASLVAATAVGVGRSLWDLLRQAARRGGFPGNARQRFGGQLVHLSVVILFFGFLGSAFTVEETASLGPGQAMRIGDYHLKLLGLRQDNNYERSALLADIAVVKNAESIGVLSPARHLYHSHPGQPTSEVIIRTTWLEDLFLILGEGDMGQGRAVIRAVVNPLVVWIWLGGVLLVLGTVVAVIPVRGVFAGDRPKESAGERRRLWAWSAIIISVALISLAFGVLGNLAVGLLAFIGFGLTGTVLFFGSALTELAARFGVVR